MDLYKNTYTETKNLKIKVREGFTQNVSSHTYTDREFLVMFIFIFLQTHSKTYCIKPVLRKVRTWPQGCTSKLQNYFESTN